MKTLNFKAQKDDLKVLVYDEDRKLYEISCVNKLHFYVICFMAQKLKEGKTVDMSFFHPLT